MESPNIGCKRVLISINDTPSSCRIRLQGPLSLFTSPRTILHTVFPLPDYAISDKLWLRPGSPQQDYLQVPRKRETVVLSRIHERLFTNRTSNCRTVPLIDSFDNGGIRSFLKRYQSLARDLAQELKLSHAFVTELFSARIIEFRVDWSIADSLAQLLQIQLHPFTLQDLVRTIVQRIGPILILIKPSYQVPISEHIETEMSDIQEIPGVYIVMIGDQQKSTTRIGLDPSFKRVVDYVRVNIHPVSENEIKSLLQHRCVQLADGTSDPISDAIRRAKHVEHLHRRDPNEDYVSAYARYLSVETSGQEPFHIPSYSPNLELSDLSWSTWDYPIEIIREMVAEFPVAVSALYLSGKKNALVDLTLQVVSGNYAPSLEYIAIRLGLGFDVENIRQTHIYIPPTTEAVLDSYFMPFTDYVARYSREPHGPIHRKRHAHFDIMVLRIFEDVLKRGSLGPTMNGFIPRSSQLFMTSLNCDPSRRKYIARHIEGVYPNDEISQIRAEVAAIKSRGEGRIIYSCGPNGQSMLIFPGFDRFIAILLSSDPNEVRKAETLVMNIRSSMRQGTLIALLICQTATTFSPISIEDHPKEKCILLRPSTESNPIELIWVNLLSRRNRQEFFGLAATRKEDTARNIQMIDSLFDKYALPMNGETYGITDIPGM